MAPRRARRVAASLVPNLSWAGAQEQAAAEALFQDARQLMQDGKFAEACPKLVDSNKLDPAVGTLLYLGECYEKNGQTASAWATFQVAAESAHKASQPERARVASDRASALLAKLSKITITVAAQARTAGLEVKRDGTDVGEATWGVGVPVDPGEHVIVAKAPGKKDWSQTVRVEPDGKIAAVEIPALEDAPTAQPQARRYDFNRHDCVNWRNYQRWWHKSDGWCYHDGRRYCHIRHDINRRYSIHGRQSIHRRG